MGSTRLAFLGFGLESVPNNQGTTTRSIFINRLITWFTQDLPSSVESEQTVPQTIRLEQNYPNPFNPSTVVRFQVESSKWVTLKVYDVLGREVVTLVNGAVEPGSHERIFDASGLASGVYLYRFEAGGFVQTKKMILIR